ncbi:MAG TPA: hypothetical protein VF476_10995 [Chitinophagaceae bacterium]
MNKPYHSDQAYIAGQFRFTDEHTNQSARLAFFKINSYKLSLVNAAFCISRKELTGIIKSSLLNYTQPVSILSTTGFFLDEMDN